MCKTKSYLNENIDMDVVNAMNDYYELKKIVSDFKGTFDELFDELKGHNRDYDLFDVNFKSITASVYCDDIGNFNLGEHFDVWQNDMVKPLYEHTTIDQLNEMCLNKN